MIMLSFKSIFSSDVAKFTLFDFTYHIKTFFFKCVT